MYMCSESAGVYVSQDLLAATITVSAFALIGPAVGYAWVHTQIESVYRNCVLGRCSNLCSIIVVYLPSLFF